MQRIKKKPSSAGLSFLKKMGDTSCTALPEPKRKRSRLTLSAWIANIRFDMDFRLLVFLISHGNPKMINVLRKYEHK